MPAQPIRITLADDHDLFLKGMHLLIDDFDNMEVVAQASNGIELLDILKTHTTDLVIVDLQMPQLDGIAATRQVKETYPGIKILLLSMHDDERLISHVMKLGANGYLLKNEPPEILHRAIETVMDKGYYFNDYVSKALLKGLPKIAGDVADHLHLKSQLGVTSREREVLQLICKELTTAEIAEKLYISKRTVEGHRKNLLEKTGVRNTAGLVIFAIRNKLIELV